MYLAVSEERDLFLFWLIVFNYGWSCIYIYVFVDSVADRVLDTLIVWGGYRWRTGW